MENEEVATQTDVTTDTETALDADSGADLLSAYLAQEEQQGEAPETKSPDHPAGQEEVLETTKPEVFTVKINGEEKQVTKDELLANYQIGKASQQKFDEAAAIRREAEQAKQTYTQHQQLLANAVQHFEQQIANFAIQPPDTALINTDPQEYLRQEATYKYYQGEQQKAQAAKAYLQQQQQQEYEVNLHRQIAEQESLLPKFIPEWKNRKVAEKELNDIMTFLSEDEGRTQDEIAALRMSPTAAKNIALIRDAMQMRQLKKTAKEKTKQVSSLPPRVEKPGVVSVDKSSAKQQALERLNRTGSMDDAAAAFMAMFE